MCRQRKIAEVVAMPAGANLKAYNSLWQLRNDTWSSLEESAIQLARAEAQQRPVEKFVEKVTELLDVLGPIERFWAFPGVQTYREGQRLFAANKYDRLAALVTKANRALVTESYLHGQSWDPGVEDDTYDHEVRAAAQARTDRPYFEILVVEDMTDEQERSLREELRRWRRPDDPFVYEIVVVPSFDDALMAARLNFRLQACVARLGSARPVRIQRRIC
jgi:arginine decarboxylase